MGRRETRRDPGADQSVAGRLDRVFVRLLTLTALLGVVVAAVFVYVVGAAMPERHGYEAGDRALQMAHAGLINQETGLRGYLLTHSTAFLQPYRSGVVSVHLEDAAITRYLGADSAAAPMLLEMRVAQQAWETEWASVVASGNAPSAPAALQSFLAEGKALFDTYRTKEAALDARIQSLSSTLDSRLAIAMGAGVTAILGLGASLVATMVMQRKRLRRELVTPVGDIVAVTAAIAGGDLQTEVQVDGPEEFRLIASGIDDMRNALDTARTHDRNAQERIESQSTQLRNILSMSRQIAGSLNLRYVLRNVADFATAVSGFEAAKVWLVDTENPSTIHTVFGTSGSVSSDPAGEVGIGLVGQSVRYGRPVAIADGDEPTAEVHPERPLLTLAVPLVVGARVIGAIEFWSVEPHTMPEGSLQVLETLAIHAAASIEAARLHGETEVLAQTDSLTGLANRRRLDHDLSDECQRASRYGRPLALIMFDVDNFKNFNDTFGHTRGDEALQEVAHAVRHEVRTTDTAYRYGGEEFAILARETGFGEAMVLAERLRKRIEDHFVAQRSKAPVTASFGVALVPPLPPVPGQIIASADSKLYRAKAKGRNRVCGPDAGPEAIIGRQA